MDKLVENLFDQPYVLVDHVVTFSLNSFQSLVFFGKFIELAQRNLVFKLVQLGTILNQDRVEEIILGVLFYFALERENS